MAYYSRPCERYSKWFALLGAVICQVSAQKATRQRHREIVSHNGVTWHHSTTSQAPYLCRLTGWSQKLRVRYTTHLAQLMSLQIEKYKRRFTSEVRTEQTPDDQSKISWVCITRNRILSAYLRKFARQNRDSCLHSYKQGSPLPISRLRRNEYNRLWKRLIEHRPSDTPLIFSNQWVLQVLPLGVDI